MYCRYVKHGDYHGVLDLKESSLLTAIAYNEAEYAFTNKDGEETLVQSCSAAEPLKRNKTKQKKLPKAKPRTPATPSLCSSRRSDVLIHT